MISAILGRYGLILKTVDGGENWSALPAQFDSDIISIRFFDDNIGYAVSCVQTSRFCERLYTKTVDGGATWFSLLQWLGWNSAYVLNPECSLLEARMIHSKICRWWPRWRHGPIIIESGIFFYEYYRGWMICDIGDILHFKWWSLVDKSRYKYHGAF
jgi:hypothetical protein